LRDSLTGEWTICAPLYLRGHSYAAKAQAGICRLLVQRFCVWTRPARTRDIWGKDRVGILSRRAKKKTTCYLFGFALSPETIAQGDAEKI
jgi:hypothetical protein